MRQRTYCTVDGCERRVKGHGLCGLHYKRQRTYGSTDDPRQSDAERFDERIEKTDGCWWWTGGLTNVGYGRFYSNGRLGLAHRFAFEHFIGPIPAGLQIDHLCHNRDLDCPGSLGCKHRTCVNPDHLEAVSQRANLLRAPLTASGVNHRKTHCAKAGHPLSGPNLYLTPHGDRQCRACRKASKAAFDARRRALR